MNDDDVGGALTGGQVDPVEATKGWDDWLQRPGNRAGLLQAGLQLMQPLAFGQTVSGQIGQAIGGAGEAITRQEAMDQKSEQADNKLAVANSRLAISQQNADANMSRANTAASRATGKKVGGLTDLMRARFAREDAKSFDKQLDSDAKAIAKQASDILADPNDPIVKQYKGKSVPEIRDSLRATRPKPKYGAVPAAEADDEEDPAAGDPATTAAPATPPVPGAKQAPDGIWYVPDPKKPGKYLRVE